eukprot:766737-Hanusia_phi.AAC.1
MLSAVIPVSCDPSPTNALAYIVLLALMLPTTSSAFDGSVVFIPTLLSLLSDMICTSSILSCASAKSSLVLDREYTILFVGGLFTTRSANNPYVSVFTFTANGVLVCISQNEKTNDAGVLPISEEIISNA